MRNDTTSRLARVISIARNHIWLLFEDESVPCSAELRKTQAREMLVPGDWVYAEQQSNGAAFVRERLARTSVLERHTPAGRKKLMAANITTLAIAAAFDRPTLNLTMIDELIAFSELHELEALLIFTKADLVSADTVRELTELYRRLGYAVTTLDARKGEGVGALAQQLDHRETLIVGASGVGKSTLFSALGGTASIGAVSERSGQGRQTTSSGRLHRFANGSCIDSPGIGEFSLAGVDYTELATLWRELRPLLGHCRFLDCRHRDEPACALRAARDTGDIAPSRYLSYQRAYLRLEASAKNQRHQ